MNIGMIIFMMVSIIKFDWWIPQMTFLFLSVAFLSAFLSKMKEKEFWDRLRIIISYGYFSK